jgi:hypothetical protein
MKRRTILLRLFVKHHLLKCPRSSVLCIIPGKLEGLKTHFVMTDVSDIFGYTTICNGNIVVNCHTCCQRLNFAQLMSLGFSLVATGLVSCDLYLDDVKPGVTSFASM